MLTQYREGRELVLGHRWPAHDDPSVAVGRLADRMGRDDAIAWARRILRELER